MFTIGFEKTAAGIKKSTYIRAVNQAARRVEAPELFDRVGKHNVKSLGRTIDKLKTKTLTEKGLDTARRHDKWRNEAMKDLGDRVTKRPGRVSASRKGK